MKLSSIIQVITSTPDLRGTTIELAALAARTGEPEPIAEVVAFWRAQGGQVDDAHTADNLTDEQIDRVRNEALDADDSRTADLCRRAMITTCSIAGIELRSQARARLAKHLNAVAAMVAS